MSAGGRESNQAEQPGRVAKAEIRTKASVEAVWSAWADPEKLAQWFVDDASGIARAGQTMTWIWNEFGVEAQYEVLAAEAPSRLVLATPQQVAPAGVIEITISSRAGETIVTIVNSGFLERGSLEDSALIYPEGSEWNDVFEGIRSGWQLALGLLKEYVEHHYGETKQSFLHLRPAQFDLNEILVWFTDEAHLRRWLTTTGAPAAVGQEFVLVLHGNEELRGRTTALTARELEFAWPQERAVIELKAFAAGPGQPMLAIRGTCWASEPDRFEQLRSHFAAALERLVSSVGSGSVVGPPPTFGGIPQSAIESSADGSS